MQSCLARVLQSLLRMLMTLLLRPPAPYCDSRRLTDVSERLHAAVTLRDCLRQSLQLPAFWIWWGFLTPRRENLLEVARTGFSVKDLRQFR